MPLMPGRPGNEHSLRREKFLATMPEEVTLGTVPIDQPAAEAVARAEVASQNGTPAGDPPEVDSVPARAGTTETEVDTAPEVADPDLLIQQQDRTPPPARISKKLEKSVELQRRADAAQKKSREASVRLRQHRAAAQQEIADATKTANQKIAQAKERAKSLEERERVLAEEESLAKTDPVRFMAKKGVTPAAVAAFARGETNPAILKAQQLEASTTTEIAKLRQELVETRKESKAQVRALEDSLVEQRETAARAELLENVYSNAEQFEALSTIYSPEEIIEKAEEMGQRAIKLQEDLDGDMLCERLEKAARKDPRWVRLQSRFERKKAPNVPPTGKPNAPRASPPNAPHTDAGRAATEQRPPRPRPPVDPDTQSRTTPSERHRDRVNRIAATTRIQGI